MLPDLKARSNRSHAYSITGIAIYIQVCGNKFDRIKKNISYEANLKGNSACMCTYRFLVPFLGEVQVVSVDDEKAIDDDKKMVRVPKGVETSELFERLGELQPVSSEPGLSQSEGYGHEHHNGYPGPTLCPFHEPPVIIGPVFSKKWLHRLIFLLCCM